MIYSVPSSMRPRGMPLHAGWYTSGVQTRAAAVLEAPPTQQEYDAPKHAHGFVLERDQFVAEYDSRVLTYRHEKTGKHPSAAHVPVPACNWLQSLWRWHDAPVLHTPRTKQLVGL